MESVCLKADVVLVVLEALEELLDVELELAVVVSVLVLVLVDVEVTVAVVVVVAVETLLDVLVADCVDSA